ncbi:MAG: DUF6152 family protein [Rhodospirillaceae bacterium]|nr:DUF6152 family protein [Rhodospirillaceae bacterium]MDE0005074.1 DUF6152 family protein [Rhodospirillaceae bacterium]
MPSPIRLQLPASVCVTVLMCMLPLPGALAHHAFVAVYNPRETATIEGEFAGLELVNPHAWIYIDVAAENGRTEQWTVEAAGKLSLARRGWTDDLFQQGEVITAVGHPALSGDTAMWMVKIVKSDGREYFAPNVEDANAIEAERRERARRALEQAQEQR